MSKMISKITEKLSGNGSTSGTPTGTSSTSYNSGVGGGSTSYTSSSSYTSGNTQDFGRDTGVTGMPSSSRRADSSSSSSSSSSSDEGGRKYTTEQRLARKTQRRSTMSREERHARQMRRMQRSGYQPRKHHRTLMEKMTGKNKTGYDQSSSYSSSSTYESSSSRSGTSGLSGGLSALGIESKLTQDKVFHEAPVVKERIHHSYEHADKTEVIEVRDRTEVKTVVQPVFAEEQRSLDVERLNEGVAIHEHGSRGLDANAEAQLRARREEIARQGGTEVTEQHSQINARPDVNVHERVHVIEQVQPVIEKDVYVPHRVEHYKKEIEIIHEAPVMGGTRVAPAITIEEFQRQHGSLHTSTTTSGGIIDKVHSMTDRSNTSGYDRTTTSSSSYGSSTGRSGEYGTTGATYETVVYSCSSSSSSSSDEGGNRYSTEQRLARKTQRRSNMSREERNARQMRRMQRSGYQPKKHHRTLMDKLTGKNKDTTNSYGQTNSSSYDKAHKEGVVEKVKNAVVGHDTNPATY